MFGSASLDWDQIEQQLIPFSVPQNISRSNAINIFLLRGVKVDIVRYNYPWLQEAEISDGLRLASTPDIAAMKLNAIAGRGLKKDFIDLDLLLNHFSLSQMLAFYREKYGQESDFMVVKSLEYFDDADKNDDPIMLTPYNWEAIKERITAEVRKLVL